MEFFKIRRTIPFMRYALVFNIISALTFVAAVFFLITKGLHFSIEFTGSTVLEAQYPEAADVEGIRATLSRSGYADNQVQNFGTSRDVLIRIPLKKGEQSANVAEDAMFALASPAFRGKVDDRTSDSETRLEIAYQRDKSLQQVRAVVEGCSSSARRSSRQASGARSSFALPARKRKR